MLDAKCHTCFIMVLILMLNSTNCWSPPTLWVLKVKTSTGVIIKAIITTTIIIAITTITISKYKTKTGEVEIKLYISKMIPQEKEKTLVLYCVKSTIHGNQAPLILDHHTQRRIYLYTNKL